MRSELNAAKLSGRGAGCSSSTADEIEHPRCVKAVEAEGGKEVQLKLAGFMKVGAGSFGSVFKTWVKCDALGEYESVAVKRVVIDRRYRDRELEMLMRLHHKNIVHFKYFFRSRPDNAAEVVNYFVFEYMPCTLSDILNHYGSKGLRLPIIYVKLYMFQLCRALAHCHRLDICHRDVKPQNLLVEPESAVLKVCDFGSAKSSISNQVNVAYVCSRYYRAPELVLGSSRYTNSVDIWSSGAVMGEMVLCRPMFPGANNSHQLSSIIKVIGSPTREEVTLMNPEYEHVISSPFAGMTLHQMFGNVEREFVDLLGSMLVYAPKRRPSALTVCAHPFFDDIRVETARLPSGRRVPCCTDFTDDELTGQKHLAHLLTNFTHPEEEQLMAEAAAEEVTV